MKSFIVILFFTIFSTSTFAALHSEADDSINPWAQVDNVEAAINEDARIESIHTVNIMNGTPDTQTFTYTYELDCDGQHTSRTQQIILQPYGYFSDVDHLVLYSYHAKPGIFPINATTLIQGESTYPYTASARLRVLA